MNKLFFQIVKENRMDLIHPVSQVSQLGVYVPTYYNKYVCYHKSKSGILTIFPFFLTEILYIL